MWAESCNETRRLNMNAYYQLIEKSQQADGSVKAIYRSTQYAQGAWNEHEQHMAPATGILSHELEQFMPRDDMRIGRISLDIFGLIAFGEFSITTRSIRPGKTIELLESQMQAQGKTCIVARAWRMLTQDTSTVAATEDTEILKPEQLPLWTGMTRWPGGFINSIYTHADIEQNRAGKGIVWINNDVEMLEGQSTTDFVHIMGMVDVANGVAPRQLGEFEWAFPNLDLQIHMHRLPQGRWLGFDAVQQYGADGIGLSSAVLHDKYGAFGRSEQIITLRKMK